jgi:hypothetical protein
MKATIVLARRIESLPADERAIVELLVHRLEAGLQCYGPWHVDDGRDYRAEVLDEVLDGLHYCAAELVRLGRHGRDNDTEKA